MRKLLSVSALASAALFAAAALSPAPAASLNNNISVGHVTMTRPNISGVAASNQYFTPNTSQGPKLKPAVGGRWVCGPIVNWDGTPHCHWVTH
jgi:outer membrane scaffolding protein for murein synthesis (MipA/OmpV family)